MNELRAVVADGLWSERMCDVLMTWTPGRILAAIIIGVVLVVMLLFGGIED